METDDVSIISRECISCRSNEGCRKQKKNEQDQVIGANQMIDGAST